MQTYLQNVKALFRAHGDPAIAQQQMKYLRNQFAFFGLKTPELMILTREIIAQSGIPEGQDLQQLVKLCYEDQHRELHHFALELVQRQLKKQKPDFTPFLEELILTKSWWDTVDWLATKLVGAHLKRFPELIPEWPNRWIESDNIWLQRTAILFQLKYKQETDEELLFRYILRRSDSKEFFVQKGAAWALREYSKTDPETVIAFIENNPLPALTRREGLKWVRRKSH
jgi:3-methyladenine DNA glycosylase AlkD